jgi:TetR/AcrR family transcriptional regulator
MSVPDFGSEDVMPPAKPGERRLQILKVLAQMLEDPKGEKITTAALAKRLDVSEAALYRHFASKAQMFEGLIEFIEQTLFGLVNKITAEEENGLKQLHAILASLLGFAEKNPGMTRVLIGDALVNEDERLQARINQLHDRLEATLKQCLRVAATQGTPPAAGAQANPDPSAHANILLCYVVGRWHQFAKSGFKRLPTELWDKQWPLLV